MRKTMSIQRWVIFCEKFYNSRNLLLNRFPVLENANNSTIIDLSKNGQNLSLTYQGDTLKFTYDNNNSFNKLRWTVTFNADEIIIKYDDIKNQEESTNEKTYSMTIRNGEVKTIHFFNKWLSDWGPDRGSEELFSIPMQEDLLDKLVQMIKGSIPQVEEAMAEYEYKLKATPILHNFFKEINTGPVPSTDKGVENLILSYLG
jgi:hypothetical protein